MVKPFNKKEVSISILLGLLYGLLNYIVFYVLVIGVLTYYIIPYIVSMSNIELRDPSSFTGYTVVNIPLLTMFIGLSILGSLLKRHVKYGKAFVSLVSLLLIYIVLYTYSFGRFSGYVEDYDVNYTVDLSPLVYKILIIITVVTFAGVFIGIAREYKKSWSGTSYTGA